MLLRFKPNRDENDDDDEKQVLIRHGFEIGHIYFKVFFVQLFAAAALNEVKYEFICRIKLKEMFCQTTHTVHYTKKIQVQLTIATQVLLLPMHTVLIFLNVNHLETFLSIYLIAKAQSFAKPCVNGLFLHSKTLCEIP